MFPLVLCIIFIHPTYGESLYFKIEYLQAKTSMINKVTLIGHLGSDPEVRHLENGISVAQFSVATNESYKDNMGNWQDKTEWHKVVAWRALAERAQNSLKKGSLVYVDGKVSTRKWQDKDGNDRYTTDIVANYFRLLNSRDGGNSNMSFPTAQDAPANIAAPNNSNNNLELTNDGNAEQKKVAASQPEVADAMDDDLPF